MIVSPSATCSYQASIIASSAAAAVGNGLLKTLRDGSWSRCRSDQIQVVASGSVYAAGPIARARLISVSVCRRFTIERTGGTSDCRSSST